MRSPPFHATSSLLAALPAFAVAVITAAVPAPLAAQQMSQPLIHGRLIDDGTRAVIPAVAVHLLTAGGERVLTVFTDSTGTFRMRAPMPGEYRLRGERIGYRTTETEKIKLLAGDALSFDFYLSTSAVLLAPIEVTASARDWGDRWVPAGMEPVYERMRFAELLGTGKFFTRRTLAEYEGVSLTGLLMNVPGLRPDGSGGVVMRRAGGSGDCAPLIYLNGAKYPLMGVPLDQLFGTADLEAVEVYRGASQIPAEFSGSDAQCGVIALWTRRGD